MLRSVSSRTLIIGVVGAMVMLALAEVFFYLPVLPLLALVCLLIGLLLFELAARVGLEPEPAPNMPEIPVPAEPEPAPPRPRSYRLTFPRIPLQWAIAGGLIAAGAVAAGVFWTGYWGVAGEHPPARELPRAAIPRPPPEPAGDSAAAENEVRAFVYRWAALTRSGDAAEYEACYAPVVDVYFRQRNVPRADVRRSLEGLRRKYGAIELFNVTDIKIQPEGPDAAVAELRKRWNTAGPRRFAGEETERLALQKTGGQWQIKREEELLVAWIVKGE